MAGIYTTIGLVLLCVIAWTLLREGRRTGWYAILFALIFGGGLDIFAGAFFYSHGFPFYEALTGVPVQGFGWQLLYLYFVA
jgi:lipoprotein signal peptidase